MYDASIVIPTYNQKDRLELVLYSINELNYDKNKFEVIVVDDCSDDGTEECIKSINKKYEFKYIKHKKNEGRSSTRNDGAMLAEGRIIIFLDGDRIPCKDYIKEHIKAHYNRKNTIVIGECIEYFDEKFKEKKEIIINEIQRGFAGVVKRCRYFNYSEIVNKIYDSRGNTKSKIAWITLMSGNFSISKKDFEKTNGFETGFKKWGFENFEYGYRLLKNNYCFHLSRNAYNIHIFHRANRKVEENKESLLYFYRKYEDGTILKLNDFLNGKISLQQLGGVDNCSDNDTSEDFFVERRFGSRVLL